MSKINRRWLETVWTNSDCVRAEDIPYSESYNIKQIIDTNASASTILSSLLTVDGPSSGLNADLLDDHHIADLILSSEKGSVSGVCPLDSNTKILSTYLPDNFSKRFIDAETFNLDTVDTGCTYGSYNNIPTVDFEPTIDGSIYYSFLMSESTAFTNLIIDYYLNTSSDSTIAIMQTTIYKFSISSTSLTQVSTDTINLTSSLSNTRTQTSLISNIIPISSTNFNNNDLIVLKIKRNAANSSDTFPGTVVMFGAIIII